MPLRQPRAGQAPHSQRERAARPPRPRRRAAALAALASLLVASPAPAAKPKPSVKQACADSFVQVQQQRLAGKLIEARREAKACAREVCPAITQKECTVWATELEAAVPSVLLRVLDASGHEVVDATVMLDGKPFEALRSGLAAEVNPGPHVFEIARPSGPTLRREIVLYEGQKTRLLDFSLEPEAPPKPAEAPRPAPKPADPAPSPGPPTLAYVLGGVGVAGLVGFGVLGLSARSSYNDLEKSCSPSCSSDRVDSAKQRALLADVSLGVGVVALGAAAYLYFRPRDAGPPPSSSATSFDLRPLPGGGSLTVWRTF